MDFRQAQSPETGDVLFVADAGGFATDCVPAILHTCRWMSLGYHYDIWDTGELGAAGQRPSSASISTAPSSGRCASGWVHQQSGSSRLPGKPCKHYLSRWRKAVHHRPEPCGATQHVTTLLRDYLHASLCPRVTQE